MVEDTITMPRWEAYEAEWVQSPTVDDLAAAYLEYKPPGTPSPKDETAMTAEDFMKFVRQTGGRRLGPTA
jgi:hypothetical protein